MKSKIRCLISFGRGFSVVAGLAMDELMMSISSAKNRGSEFVEIINQEGDKIQVSISNILYIAELNN